MSNTQRNNGDIEFKVSARLGVISSYSTGWTKELNVISWNGGPAKYDIRDWDPDHERMSRGVTLHEEEARTLLSLLDTRFSNGDRGGRRVRGTWPEDEKTVTAVPEEEQVETATTLIEEEPVYEE